LKTLIVYVILSPTFTGKTSFSSLNLDVVASLFIIGVVSGSFCLSFGVPFTATIDFLSAKSGFFSPGSIIFSKSSSSSCPL